MRRRPSALARLSRSVQTVAVALLLVATGMPARAQSAPNDPGPIHPAVPLTIESDTAHTRFEVQRDVDLQPLAGCDDACSVQLPVGRYRLVVHGSDGVASGRRWFYLYAPKRIRMTPDAPWQRWTGLTLAVAGTAAVLGGFALLLVKSCSASDASQCSTAFEGSETVGAGLILGGVAVSIPGWVMFGKSFEPGLRTLPCSAGRC